MLLKSEAWFLHGMLLQATVPLFVSIPLFSLKINIFKPNVKEKLSFPF